MFYKLVHPTTHPLHPPAKILTQPPANPVRFFADASEELTMRVAMRYGLSCRGLMTNIDEDLGRADGSFDS